LTKNGEWFVKVKRRVNEREDIVGVCFVLREEKSGLFVCFEIFMNFGFDLGNAFPRILPGLEAKI
jgi:hypothetical protein